MSKVASQYNILYNDSVSPGLNEVPGAHDDEQQSARPGARREARVVSREKTHVATCVQTPPPNKNYKFKATRYMRHIDYRKVYA